MSCIIIKDSAKGDDYRAKYQKNRENINQSYLSELIDDSWVQRTILDYIDKRHMMKAETHEKIKTLTLETINTINEYILKALQDDNISDEEGPVDIKIEVDIKSEMEGEERDYQCTKWFSVGNESIKKD